MEYLSLGGGIILKFNFVVDVDWTLLVTVGSAEDFRGSEISRDFFNMLSDRHVFDQCCT